MIVTLIMWRAQQQGFGDTHSLCQVHCQTVRQQAEGNIQTRDQLIFFPFSERLPELFLLAWLDLSLGIL